MKKIAVIGLPFFARRTALALRSAGFDARFVPQPGRSLLAYPGVMAGISAVDLVYAIGSSMARTSPLHLISLAGKPILMHWVGSDVQVALEVYQKGRISLRLLRGATHWADAPWLVDELSALGIKATERLLPVPAAIGSPLPLDPTFRVLIYLPREFQSAYDIGSTLAVVRSLPEVQFMVAGGFRPPHPLQNLEALGFVDNMPTVYARSAALLRLTHHDGMSHSVIEALSFGRHVGWNYPLEGARRVGTPAEAIEMVEELAHKHGAAELEVNVAGARRVADRYDPAAMLEQVRAGLERLL